MKWRIEFGFYARPATEYGNSPYYPTSTHVVEAENETAALEAGRQMARGKRVFANSVHRADDAAPLGQIGRLVSQAGHYSGL